MESSNLLHGRCVGPVQNFKSFAYRTAIPPEEHAAASDKLAEVKKNRVKTEHKRRMRL
ncbi:UNVERIFIED_CONTAM: hypothetical protein Sindi_2170400 [Sesamum indicum]